MKILTIDDQQLILLSIEKKLTDLGFTVETANTAQEGIALYETFKPDLVLVDMNLPDMPGLEIIKYIRFFRKKDTPILVLSGNTDERVILSGFSLGIDDYMKKPVSLDEMAARVIRLVGKPKIEPTVLQRSEENRMLQKHCVGLVIPCYNEQGRLSTETFREFAHKNLGYHLCFVNDGSTDATLEILHEIRSENPNNISVYNCAKNGGKAEAVRQGIQYLIQDHQLDYVGFLDADLSTDFTDFEDLVQTIETTDFKIVSGSRITRMGADITKETARKWISRSINLIIRTILQMPFKDTQCGAKVMKREVARHMFKKKFITRWLFDVEIFMRMRKHYGQEEAISSICEQPLNRWIHADGSKLSMKDSVKIIGQLGHIAFHYR